jgi:glucose 1-dehydrogenase
MPVCLAGQTALVTGASSGIGRACAVLLSQCGATVAVNHFNDAERAQAVVDHIAQQGGAAMPVAADVSNEQAVDGMVQAVVSRFGTIDILISNAGIEQNSPFETMSLAQWQRVLDVNLTGQFLCARAVIREFLRRADRLPAPPATAIGKIVCTSSVHQTIPWAHHANYAASKGGARLLVETLAQEFANRRIRVNAVAPGAIRTGINKAAWGTSEAMQGLLKMIPYGRIGETEDVARAVAWLASDESDYITGTTLVIDGGMSLFPAFAKGNG